MSSEAERLREENARFRQVMEELSIHERMYHTLFEASHDAVFLLDGRTIHDCNRRAVEIFGYSRRTFIGSDFTDLTGPLSEAGNDSLDDAEKQLEEQFGAMNDRGTRFFEWNFRRNSGEVFRCEVSLAPLTLYGREFYFASIRDIAVRTRFEQDLRLRTAQLQATLESLPFDFWINDTENRTYMQNSYSKQLWGEQSGAHMEEVTSDEEVKRQWRDSNYRALGGEVVEREITYRNEGREKIYRNIVAPVWGDGEVIGILGLNIDITDYKHTHRQLEESLRQVEVLLKEVHHRVKNNLQIIISMLNLEKDKVDSRPHDVLHDIENRIGTMALIHEQLYDSESLATIRMRDYLENLSGSIASSFNLHHESIAIVPEVEDILFSLDLAIPVGIIANELITNSIKHAFPEGGGTITVSLEELQDSYRFGVRDDGSGPGGDRNRTERQAPEQEAEEEPPFRERGSRAHKSPQQPKQRAAAGLGLTLVEQLAHQIQGATSYEENGGFSVAITFPKEGV